MSKAVVRLVIDRGSLWPHTSVVSLTREIYTSLVSSSGVRYYTRQAERRCRGSVESCRQRRASPMRGVAVRIGILNVKRRYLRREYERSGSIRLVLSSYSQLEVSPYTQHHINRPTRPSSAYPNSHSIAHTARDLIW